MKGSGRARPRQGGQVGVGLGHQLVSSRLSAHQRKCRKALLWHRDVPVTVIWRFEPALQAALCIFAAMPAKFTIPAYCGKAVALKQGQHIKVTHDGTRSI